VNVITVTPTTTGIAASALRTTNLASMGSSLAYLRSVT
jgi:hypothetical protein